MKQAHLLDSSDSQILYNLALTLLRTNQAEAAASKFRLLLSLTPDSDNALKGLELCEQMLLDQSRVEALKKKRQEAQKTEAAPPPPAASTTPAKTVTQAPPKPTPVASPPQVSSSAPMKSSGSSPLPATMQPASTTPAASTEPKGEAGVRELMAEIRSSASYHPHDALKAPGPYPDGVNPSHRELYLSESDFQRLFGATKEEFLSFPQWKQVFTTS